MSETCPKFTMFMWYNSCVRSISPRVGPCLAVYFGLRELGLVKCKDCTNGTVCTQKDIRLKFESIGFKVICTMEPEEPDNYYSGLMQEVPGFYK